MGEPGIQKALLFAGERQNKDVLTGLTSMEGCSQLSYFKFTEPRINDGT